MKVACVQFDIAWEDKQANYTKVHDMLAKAQLPRYTLTLLPEMFSTGFSMQVAQISEGEKAESEAFVKEIARTFGLYVMAGVVNSTNGVGRNEAVVYSPLGNEVARYCKMQTFNLGGEGQHYAPGDDIVTFQWEGFTVAPFICYDLRFPELFRAAVNKHAQLFAVIANWPVHRIGHWVTLLQARAIENQAYVVGTNRCGKDPNLDYNGQSVILSPKGEILAEAGAKETIITADVNVDAVASWRSEFPALADMRHRDFDL